MEKIANTNELVSALIQVAEYAKSSNPSRVRLGLLDPIS